MSNGSKAETLQGRTKSLSILRYELKTENCSDANGNDFIRYSMFNDNGKSITESLSSQFNYFDCEGEYSKIIGIALYDETYKKLKSTLISIFKNRQDLLSDGEFFLSKTLVVIICDGVEKLHKSIKDEFEKFNLYNQKFMDEANKDKGLDVTYFFQGELGYHPEEDLKNNEENSIESSKVLKVVFGVKTQNRKKLHSHMILFMVCARKIKPEFIVLLDTGTCPEPSGINLLIRAMTEDSKISGCCGELKIDLDPTTKENSTIEMNSILKAQWLEYRFAHCLQKTFESSCGFIPVLPGAFCAYRWSALSCKDFYVIKEYLKPFDKPEVIGWTESNIYHLAEDRVILDKISKLDTETSVSWFSSGHFLTFIKDSKATTDGTKSLLQLINQRRRWNNGAWFSLNQTLWKTCNTILICKTKHSPIRKFIMIMQICYYILLISFQWCSVGAYYLAFAMALRKVIGKEQQEYLVPVFEGIYLIFTFCLFCISLVIGSEELNDDKIEVTVNGEKIPSKKNRCGAYIFNFLALFYFLTLLYILSVLLYVIIAVGFSSVAYITIIIIVPCTLVLSLLLYDPTSIWTYLKCCPYYIYYIPTYINILQIYSICKTDDVSWGTRGNSGHYNTKYEAFKYKKFLYLLTYVLCNSIFGFLFEKFYAYEASNVLGFLYGAALILILLPFLGEIYYLILYLCSKFRPSRVNAEPISVNEVYNRNNI